MTKLEFLFFQKEVRQQKKYVTRKASEKVGRLYMVSNSMHVWNSPKYGKHPPLVKESCAGRKSLGKEKQYGTKAIDGFSVRKLSFRRFFLSARWLVVRNWGPQRD